eukprot:scaffold308264_cov26-Tisochrysis_lutea.AAC.2
MSAAPRATDASSSFAPNLRSSSFPITAPASDAQSAAVTVSWTAGVRVPPPNSSTLASGESDSVARTRSTMMRSFSSDGLIRSANSSRWSEIGTSHPSTRFSTVTLASGSVDSSLRNLSQPSSNRHPARVPGLMGTPCAFSTCEAK